MDPKNPPMGREWFAFHDKAYIKMNDTNHVKVAQTIDITVEMCGLWSFLKF